MSYTFFRSCTSIWKRCLVWIGGYARLFGDLGCINHCRFLKLELDRTDVGRELDVFIITTYCRKFANFRTRIFSCSCVYPVYIRSKKRVNYWKVDFYVLIITVWNQIRIIAIIWYRNMFSQKLSVLCRMQKKEM